MASHAVPCAALTTMLLLAGCGGNGDDGTDVPGATSCDDVKRADLSIKNESHTVVAIATNKGCIVGELEDGKAPITVANLKKLVEEGFYKDLLFHRIIKGFMVQTGGMKTDGEFKESPHPAIKNEARTSGLRNLKYTFAMARTNSPDSATNQFFINTDDNCFLDAREHSTCQQQAGVDGYAVFGAVVNGFNVVDSIEGTPVEAYAPGKHCQQDSQPSCPTTDILLLSAKVI